MRALTFITATILLSGCGNDRTISPVLPNAFQYTAYDSSGHAVVGGWFKITSQETSRVTGEWHFAKIGSPPRIGPQTGDGTFLGFVHDGVLNVDLNPGWADNNVFLRGTLAHDAYHGTWTWSTLRGTTGGGTFSSVKR